MADFMSISSAPDLAAAHGAPSHKQAMDRMYRLQRHIYDLTRRHYLLGREHLIANLRPPAGSNVLEIGCGTGRNLIQVAKTYSDCKVFGFDISDEMLKSTTQAISRNGLVHRIRVAQGDATNFNPVLAFGVAAFERIYVSYTLSMIPNWPAVLTHARSLVCPGGEIHIVDFGQCERLPTSFRNLLMAWLRLFGVYPQPLLKSSLEGTARKNGDHVSSEPLYRGYSRYLRLQARPLSQKSA
jgi:S-adenosylmethionine-diacylgycerolhomoserine-N-methlytransferase